MADLLTKKGVVKDIFGRYRRIPKRDISSQFKRALNMFINAPVQGACASYLNIAQIKIRKQFQELGMWLTDIWPTNEVHDEICYIVKEEYAEDAGLLIQDLMRTAVMGLRVPIDSDLSIADNWGQCK